MEEDKNLEQNLDEKLHISYVRQRFIDVLENRLNKLKLDRERYSNSFKGRISPTYTQTAHISFIRCKNK
jgi:hypothetical protein